ncbi:MAG: DnaJ domain-containing protein [Fibrobacter sp.]|nr:DnaJ domain-containing protein [Fibrobacter sp.]
MFSIFNFGKRRKEQAQQEREQIKRVKKTERNLSKSAAINQRTTDLLAQTLESKKDLQQGIDEFNNQVADFQKTVDENRSLQVELQQQQNRLADWEENLKNRQEDNRKEEISLHIRSESIKKDEERVAKKDADLDAERQNIKDERSAMKDRVAKAEKAEEKFNREKKAYEDKQKDADALKDEYKAKITDLESREKECAEKEASIASRLAEVEEKERAFESRERGRREAFDAEKEHWEKDRAEIENNLNEKIKEYDRKMADMDAATETLDNIAFDDSEDGKKAKIVVKETIRVSIKALEDSIQKFRELDEKYASGTFKGFSVPIDEINVAYEELKSQYAAIKEHAESTGLDFSIWLDKIESNILEADKNIKSFLFAEGYRHTIEGLSYCKGYEDIIKLLNDYAGSSEEPASESKDDDWEDYYSFLYESDYDDTCDYTKYKQPELEKRFKKMAKKYHPDKASEENREEYTEHFKKLNEIWSILSDAEKRSAYDSSYIDKRNSHHKTED